MNKTATEVNVDMFNKAEIALRILSIRSGASKSLKKLAEQVLKKAMSGTL